MITGAYTLDLYCEHEKTSLPVAHGIELRHLDDKKGQATFIEIDRREAFHRARDFGWTITGNKALCPQCTGHKPKAAHPVDVRKTAKRP